MAEILISLTIIGIIAAITLPSLRANINEKTWAAQRKALYSRMSQAIAMLPSMNGYGEYEGTWNNNVVTVTKDTAAASFVADGLNKVLQINNICTIPANTSSENARKELKKCGIPEKITTMADMNTGKTRKIDFPTKLSELNPMFTSTHTLPSGTQLKNPQRYIDTLAAAFETSNGESVAVFYNRYCQSVPENLEALSSHVTFIQPMMCANFIYDMNGTKGPNKIGKDIGFITALYPTDSNIVAPMPLEKNAQNGNENVIRQVDASSACKAQDKNSRLPSIEELFALFYNKQFIGISSGNFWSSTFLISNNQRAWALKLEAGYVAGDLRSYSYNVRCIKR